MILEIVDIFAEMLTFASVIGAVVAIAVLIWAVSTERNDE